VLAVTTIAPFLIGVIFQLGAFLGALATRTGTDVDPTGDVEFAHRMDRALSVPSGAALIGATLLVPRAAGVEKATFAAVSAVGAFALYVWISRRSADRYDELSPFGVTPLNALVMVGNVVMGSVALVTT
jgi:hypothetical protein